MLGWSSGRTGLPMVYGWQPSATNNDEFQRRQFNHGGGSLAAGLLTALRTGGAKHFYWKPCPSVAAWRDPIKRCLSAPGRINVPIVAAIFTALDKFEGK
ncbi:MAG: hypothetical protein M1588_01480, partial [Planctomycetes bacterium]|nr:hypothetical protein [Planctomycetota bacterium]